MRLNLEVSFAEKDAAKQLGARLDTASKLWYVEDKADMTSFSMTMYFSELASRF